MLALFLWGTVVNTLIADYITQPIIKIGKEDLPSSFHDGNIAESFH